MVEVFIKPAKVVSSEQIEALCLEAGLLQTMRGSLKSMPANMHWHFKKGKEKGVLEITLLHQTGEIILAVHQNRRGGWVEEVMAALKAQLS